MSFLSGLKDYTAFGGYKGWWKGPSGSSTGQPNAGSYGFDPSQFLNYAGFLPPTGDALQSLGGGFGGAEATAANQLFGTKSVQLLDFLSSMGLQKALLPLFAGQELDLAKQILPGQLSFQGDLFKQAYGQAGSNFSDLTGLQSSLAQTAQAGLAGLGGGFGEVPSAVDSALQNSYASGLARFGLEGSPAGQTQAATAYAATRSMLGENIRQSRINQALGIQQGGLGLAGFLTGIAGNQLGGVGLPDIGFSPIGFQGASGVYTGATDLLASHDASKLAKTGAWANFGGGILGGLFGNPKLFG